MTRASATPSPGWVPGVPLLTVGHGPGPRDALGPRLAGAGVGQVVDGVAG